MLNKIIFIGLFLFTIHAGYAQKISEKVWDGSGIKTLWIESNALSMVRIISTDTTNISLIARVEGEYNEQILVSEKSEDGTLTLRTGTTPYFEKPNDKLAAHKVLSIEFDIQIPNDINVVVSSEGASLETTGEIQTLKVVLAKGNCTLNNFLGNAEIFTEEGSILVYALENLKGTADTQHGSVKNDLLESSKFMVEARSVNGDITLLKSQ